MKIITGSTMNVTESMKTNITIITPSYNMADYLPQTIESVLSNLEEDDEYYIIDGGSTDESVDVIKQYEDKITGWISEKDDGYAHALSKGFEKAEGDILCWINAGDLLLPHTFDIVRLFFSENKNTELIFGDDYHINEEGVVLQHSKGKVSDLSKIMMFGGWTPLQDACFWRKELYERVNGIDKHLKYAADYDMFLKMSLSGQYEYIPAVLSAFRKHDGQKSIQFMHEYRNERYSSMKNARSNFDANPLIKRAQIILYWVWVRMRSRLFFLNSCKSNNVGENINSLSAFKL